MVEVIACGNSSSELEKKWNLQGESTKKLNSLGLFFFGLGVFKLCNILSWKHTCNDFRVFQNFKDTPRNFSEVFSKAFPKPNSCFFFLNRSLVDR